MLRTIGASAQFQQIIRVKNSKEKASNYLHNTWRELSIMRKVLLVAITLLAMAGSASAGARDYFSEFSKDFGITPRGPALTHYFQVKNTTNASVTIGTPRVSCGCVSASVLKSQLAPNETTVVVAIMDTRRIPQANVVKSVTVYVPFLSPVLEEVSLVVQAIARDDLVISPESLAFGTVKKGKGATTAVRVTLYNYSTWQITESISTGLYVVPTVKEASRKGNEVAFDVTATLKEDCPVGNWVSDIWLKTNAPGMEKIRIPVTVNVVASITASPETVNLSAATVGETAEQRILLQGTSPFKILEVKGTDDEYRIKASTEVSRPVHILTLAVKPKVTGPISRSFEILTDSKEQPSVTVTLKGNASK